MIKNACINKFTVLRNLTNNPTFFHFLDLGNENDHYKLISLIIEHGAEENFCKWLQDLILYDENAFSKLCASGRTPNEYLINNMAADLDIIFNGVRTLNTHNAFNLGDFTYPFVKNDADATVSNLIDFYGKNGFGDFIRYRAFDYADGQLKAIKSTSPITLNSLKGYKTEKALVIDNVLNLIAGLPYSHMLLYGDRGTGKSSPIHAVLNEYFKDGLRIVQLNKENVLYMGELCQKLAQVPLKFLLFIDDLSLGEYDDKVSSLKASLEGTIASIPTNVMIVATSNRRHIVKESFKDRENSVHLSDSLNEQLSLSDRFGLTVMFSTTDKAQYLSIVEQLAQDCGIAVDDKLKNLAERWALVKGERSPRRAKQFVDLSYSCLKSGKEINF